MSAADVPRLQWLLRSTQHRKHHWDDHIVVRPLTPRIDRELAEGMTPWSTVDHAARTPRGRSRHLLARSLELLVESAEQSNPAGRSTAVAPCREQVRHALAEIMGISSRLRSAEPVDARGIAMLRALLGDGGGPCYVRSHPAALTEALQEVSRWLHVAS